MNSDWELIKKRSQYHFDNTTIDPRWDTVQHLGNIKTDWATELQSVIDNAKPVTWRTRGKENDPLARPDQDHDREEYDLERIGMGRDYVVTNLNYELPPLFQRMADQFALDNSMARIHVQTPGQVWNLHLDKL